MNKKTIIENWRRKILAAVPTYTAMPQGWQVIENATTAPAGYVWICNGKSLFGGARRHGLLKTI